MILAVVALAAMAAGCGGSEQTPDGSAVAPSSEGRVLLVSLAVLGENDDGSPQPLPARLGILTPTADGWTHRFVEDPDSNVFHKAMAYPDGEATVDFGGEPRAGILTFGGSGAAVKLWRPDGEVHTLWEADFGGRFSRMRDAEVGDIYGDGSAAIAVATHDQGVVAVLRPDGAGAFTVEELDRQPDTIVHEIELGDLDGDGVVEIYATPSLPNKLDGSPQPGTVVRYVPAAGEGRVEVAALGDRHAKEILVTDVEGDGRDELYVSVEAVSGGSVEIRRYDAGTDPAARNVVATLNDRLCRFLTAGDVDGDGRREMVAATHRAGLWLLRPPDGGDGRWHQEQIAADSSGFEHAAILADLDGDARDELYVASDDQDEVRRYLLTPSGWQAETLLKYEDGLARFTWNLTVAPAALLPAAGTDDSAGVEDVAGMGGDGSVTSGNGGPTSGDGGTTRGNERTGREEATAAPEPASAVAESRGLIARTAGVAPGYVLFGPLLSDTTYLIDEEGRVVHTWKADYAPSGGIYLLDNGDLIRPAREPDVPRFSGGGQGGRIQQFTWDGELVWDWLYASDRHLLHHDVEPLPNGNLLAISWEYRSAEEARRAGRRPDLIPEAGLWPDKIIEIEPRPPDGARVIWEWRMWDHLVQDHDPDAPNYGDPAAHPERIDVNGDREPLEVDPEELERLKALGYVPADTQPEDLQSDLLHTNAVAYNPELDQIAVSTPRFNEIWIIDHSTTTEEAAGSTGGRWGRGGDLLYRWGNPQTYRRGDEGDRQLFAQHDVRWIPPGLPGAGNLTIFNNDVEGPDGPYSSVVEVAPPVDARGRYVIPAEGPIGPATPAWTYVAPDRRSFHAPFISGAQRLPNGNTLINSGPQGRFFEVTPSGAIVWEYRDPHSGDVRMPDGSTPHPVGEFTYAIFRATKVLPDHPALAGRQLRPLDPQPAVAGAAASGGDSSRP